MERQSDIEGKRPGAGKGKARASRRSIDMLHGGVALKLLLFALPLAVIGVLQQLFNAADVAVLGRYAGKYAMASVGANTPVIGLLVNLLLGLALGSNVMIARHIGSGRRQEVHAAVQTSVVLALATGFAIMAVGEALAGPLLRLLGTPPEVMPDALAYLRLFLLGLPGISLYNFEAAILRSRGDTRSALWALLVSSALNIALDVGFVSGLGLGAGAVGFATAVSYTAAGLILLLGLVRTDDLLRVDLRRLFVSRPELRGIVRIGLPAGIQGMVFSLSNLVVQSALNSLGPETIAASAAAFTIEINLYCVQNAIGQGVTTFVSQNHGAGNIPRCFHVGRVGMLLEMLVVTPLAALVILFGRDILRLFNPEEAVVAIGFVRILWIVLPTWVSCGMEIISGVLRGFGHSMPPAMASLVCICGVRLLWVWGVFPSWRSFECLMAVYPLSWIVTLAVLIWIYVKFRHEFLREHGARRPL